MHLLFYSTAFLPDLGGVERHVATLSAGLSELIKVTVVTQVETRQPDEYTFEVVRRPGKLALLRMISQADCIQIAGPALFPLIAALLLRKPLIVQHHGYQAACLNGLLLRQPNVRPCDGAFRGGRLDSCFRCQRSSSGTLASLTKIGLTIARRVLCKFARSNVVVSEHVARRVGLPNTTAIHSGVQLPTVRIVNTSSDGPVTFGYVGRLVQEKGIAVLIASAHALIQEGYDIRLVIVGDGPVRGTLEQMVRQLGQSGRITFKGSASGDALEREFLTFDVLVVPSICEETFGLVAVEGTLRGIPVIASNVGGLIEVLGPGGILFESGSVEALGVAMKQMLSPSVRRRYAEERRSFAAARFCAGQMVERYLQHYRQLGLMSSPPNQEEVGQLRVL